MDLKIASYAALIALFTLIADASETVTVSIYQLTKSKWEASQEDEFKSAIVDAANDYCQSNYEGCSFASSPGDDFTAFTTGDVNIVSYSYTKPFLTVVFSLDYADSSESEGSATEVPSSDVQDIIVGSDFDGFNYHITEVDGVDLSIPPNTTLNIALSVVGVAILAICLTVCLILNWKCGSDPEPVGSDDESADLKSGKTQPIELTSVETVKTVPPSGTNGSNSNAVDT